MTPLDLLADEPRWVAWRNEDRGRKPTKIPYAPKGQRAKADDPSTWGTRAEAEARAAKIINGQGGGIGIQLGDVGADMYLAGVDLDSCLVADGTLAQWAENILVAVPSYAEVSPSGCGIKAFFFCTADDVRPFLELVGITDPKQWGLKRGIEGEDGRDHGPGIELYMSGRYFTVTGDRWMTQPDSVMLLDWPALERLAQLIPPARSTGKAYGKTAGADNSRSAIAFRKGAALRRAGKTFPEMVAALRADPETAAWVREKGDASGGRELSRIWERAGSTIQVLSGLRHQAADQGLAAMGDAGIAFYQRDRKLVRVHLAKAKASDGKIVMVPGILPVSLPMLTRALGQSARWERINDKRQSIRIDPPKGVAEQVAEMVEDWPFPPLAGVIGTPTLRPDGSLLMTEGYDDVTGMVLLGAPKMPAIPDRPTKHDAEAALARLDALLDEFPFVPNTASRSVALSMLLTPVFRGALAPAVPMHLVTAPQAGTGKSYLADLAALIATGERCAVMSVSPKPEETEKRLIGAALAGFPIIALDNCREALQGDFLCQVTERPLLQLRPLKSSDLVRVANTFTTFANGNNVTVADDLVRRTIRCALDANIENPEARTFCADPVAMVLADRGGYIAACLTIARAYMAAGQPERLPRLPSYERWSDLVRSALVWLGQTDPVSTMAAARSHDPIRQARADVFDAWIRELGEGGAYQTSELIQKAEEWNPHTSGYQRPALCAALIAVAASRNGPPKIDPRRLGRWLNAAENTIAVGFKLAIDRSDKFRPRATLRKHE